MLQPSAMLPDPMDCVLELGADTYSHAVRPRLFLLRRWNARREHRGLTDLPSSLAVLCIRAERVDLSRVSRDTSFCATVSEFGRVSTQVRFPWKDALILTHTILAGGQLMVRGDPRRGAPAPVLEVTAGTVVCAMRGWAGDAPEADDAACLAEGFGALRLVCDRLLLRGGQVGGCSPQRGSHHISHAASVLVERVLSFAVSTRRDAIRMPRCYVTRALQIYLE